MNKLDRDGREPLDLLEELEEVLGIASYPMNWPIGMGKAFEGLYDLYNERLELYKGNERFAKIEDGDTLFANNPFYEQAKEDIELLTEAGNEFSEEAILAGELTPVFFGSALTNFGVQTFLDTFLKFAPEPHGHKTCLLYTSTSISQVSYRLLSSLPFGERLRWAIWCVGQSRRYRDTSLIVEGLLA